VRIGRYEVERAGDTLTVAVPHERDVARALLAAGLGLAALGALLRRGRPGAGTMVVLAGLGLAGVGGVALAAGSRVRAGPAGLERDRLGGRVERWRPGEIEAVAVARRVPEAADVKSGSPPRRYDAHVLGRGGERLVRFRLGSERDAQRLARELGSALGVPVRER
jgi:hypothetical protein